MHSLALTVENLMKKWYDKDFLAAVLLEGLKFCVPTLANNMFVYQLNCQLLSAINCHISVAFHLYQIIQCACCICCVMKL